MKNERLKSYEFNCPCCSKSHKRLFEYFAKFYGPIPEDKPLDQFKDYQMLPRVVINDSENETRTVTVGDNTYRCGNCYEFFKFDGVQGEPRLLFGLEKEVANSRFEPIELTYEQAVLNSLAILDQMLNSYGCVYDEEQKKIVITNSSGKEFSFDFAEQLIKSIYGENLNYKIKGFSPKCNPVVQKQM